jgi:serine-type D-Ala-D-Ala carboxypeptidase/endopeptidase (penicillin-binding protein 4)
LFIGKIPVEIHRELKGRKYVLKQKATVIIIFILFIMLAFNSFFQTEEPPAQAFEPSGNLANEINELLINDPVLKGSLAGVSVRSAENGELLYEHIGDTRLQPASVMKLFTAAAGLSVLGEEYRFTTEILTNGKMSKGTLKGDIIIKGKGDPTLLPADFDRFAEAIKELGIQRIAGDLIADDSWFDDVRYSEDLTWNDEHQYYGSQISALTVAPNKDYDAGTVIVNLLPGKIGKEGNISLEPDTDYLKIVNQTQTVDSNGEHDINIEREHGANTIFIKGTIPADSKKTREWISVWEPSLFAMNLFKMSLEKEGITVVGKIKAGTVTNGMRELISHKSMTMSELMVPFMKLSNNGHAEVLVKEIGQVVHGEGSWEKGLEAMNSELAKLGVDTDQLMLRDGSGISHSNLIPANEITGLLYRVQKEKWFPAFHHSLPVAGVSDRMVGGTLRNRMKTDPLKENVIAKTGSLTGVSTLAGYVKTSSGKPLIFAVLLNNLLDDTQGRKIENQVADILARQP